MSASFARRARVALWRARLRAMRALGLRPSYAPPAPVARDQLAALAFLWDGRWFLKAMGRHGVDEAMRLNSEVRVSFARTEMKLMLAALGKARADDFEDAARVIHGNAEMLMGSVGGLAYDERREPDGAHAVTVRRCAAFEGAREARRRGLLDREDQACVHCCDVWRAWYATALPDHDVEVERGAFMGGGAARCDFRMRAGPRPASPSYAGGR